MPSIYNIIKDYYPSAQFAGRLATEENRLKGAGIANLPGMKIMAAKPTTFTQLVAAFQTYVHNAGNGFIWQGSSGGATGSPLLDGDQKRGECAMFARALTILAYAPPPYGLGMAKGDADLVAYSGEYRKGFVSDHNGAVLGLRANVTGQNLYFWENHKVVKYMGRFFDVVYQTIYNVKSDMTAFNIMDDPIPLPVLGAGEALYHTAEPNVAANPGRVGGFFKEFPLNTYAGPSKTMPF